MKWMRERDLLIAQTMAFVESVTGKKPEAEKTIVMSADLFSVEISGTAASAASMPDIKALMAETIATTSPKEKLRGTFSETPRETLKAVQTVAHADLRSGFHSEVSEIKARVATFRAHQEKFNREREAYGTSTMAKVHAALRDGIGPTRLEK
jgi:hypothetical protein